MKDYWKASTNEIIKEFGSSREGLTGESAKRILLEKGDNVLQEGKSEGVIEVFFKQFCDLLVVILIVAAVISMFSNNVESTIVIFAVLIMNAVLGTVQHLKAKKSLESLKKLSSPTAKVMRDGKKLEIDSAKIVPGDIVILEAGDLVTADGRIIANYSLKVNESAITGESTNIEKTEAEINDDVALGDRINMVYSGSLVTYGRAEVLVTATGMDTEIGKIAGLMNDIKAGKTPLQVSLDKFSKSLAIVIMIISVLVFGISVYRDMKLIDALMFAVALAVAAIPEALSSIVTIVQAMGTAKMAKENAIMKELKAVEGLGCVSVICSDKTGTLTQNKMTVQQIFVNGMVKDPKEINLCEKSDRLLVFNSILNNDSSIDEGKSIGDPTETALLDMYRRIDKSNVTDIDGNEETIRSSNVRLEEIPFDSDRKLMSSKYEIDNKKMVFVKGAVDVLIDRCDNIIYNSEIKILDDKEKEKIYAQNQQFSENGLRVLAFAYKETDEKLTLESENKLTFIGLISMIDPERSEAVQAVADAKMAGIRTVMITGDHKVTAIAIAKKLGIFEEGDMAFTGGEVDAMTDAELEEKIEKVSVYARVSPENKIRIVSAWQKKGKVVAMTGDGVNDAPALKRADIGVAMGITGTEVSKDAASMILADDNFATIIKAVINGRSVYRNIKNAILFLLSGNMAAILAVLFTSLMGLPVPFDPVHLLFINLLTDSLPAIAIGMEAVDSSLLNEKPRKKSEGILNKRLSLKILFQGAVIAACVIIAYYFGLDESPALASTMAFATLTLARLFHSFNCRSGKFIFKSKLMSNPFSIYAFLGGVALLAIVLFVTPLHGLFSVTTLSLTKAALIAGFALLPTALIQIGRLFKRK